MTTIWAKGCTAIILAVLSASVMAAGPVNAASSVASKQAPVSNPMEPTRFELPAGSAVARQPVLAPARSRPPLRRSPANAAQFADSNVEYIEGPSWSYQTSRRGPVLEMGALGGGAMEDAPFLAHVAVDWRF